MKRFIPLLSILALSAVLHLWGIGWGGPHDELIPIVFGSERTVKDLTPAMLRAHGEIRDMQVFYGAGYSPAYNSMERIRVRVDGSERAVDKETVNALRSYLTRSYGADEQAVLAALSKMDPKRLDFNPRFFEYGGAYLYPLAFFLKVCAVTGLVNLRPDMSYYFLYPGEMGRLYAAGRAFGAIGALAAVFFFYLLCSLLFKDRVLCLLLTLLFGACPALVLWSHYLKPHSFGLIWIVLTLWAVYHFREGKSTRWLYAGACFAGLAFGTLLSYGYALWFVVLGLLWSGRKAGFMVRHGLGTVLVFLITFLITNPYLVIARQEFVQELAYLGRYWRPALAFGPSLVFFGAESMRYGLGTWLWLFVLGGLLTALCVSPRRKGLFILCALLPGLVYFARLTGAWVHYALAIYPLLILAAGLFWESRAHRSLALAGCGAVAVYTLLFTAAHVALFGRENIRTEAGRWINTGISAGASIALLEPPAPWRTPPFRFLSYNLMMSYNERMGPAYVVVSEYEWARGGRLEDVYARLSGYRVVREWSKPASIFGLTFDHPEKIPYDWCHPNPKIILWKRR